MFYQEWWRTAVGEIWRWRSKDRGQGPKRTLKLKWWPINCAMTQKNTLKIGLDIIWSHDNDLNWHCYSNCDFNTKMDFSCNVNYTICVYFSHCLVFSSQIYFNLPAGDVEKQSLGTPDRPLELEATRSFFSEEVVQVVPRHHHMAPDHHIYVRHKSVNSLWAAAKMFEQFLK